jgi:hypothetical protein
MYTTVTAIILPSVALQRSWKATAGNITHTLPHHKGEQISRTCNMQLSYRHIANTGLKSCWKYKMPASCVLGCIIILHDTQHLTHSAQAHQSHPLPPEYIIHPHILFQVQHLQSPQKHAKDVQCQYTHTSCPLTTIKLHDKLSDNYPISPPLLIPTLFATKYLTTSHLLGLNIMVLSVNPTDKPIYPRSSTYTRASCVCVTTTKKET